MDTEWRFASKMHFYEWGFALNLAFFKWGFAQKEKKQKQNCKQYSNPLKNFNM